MIWAHSFITIILRTFIIIVASFLKITMVHAYCFSTSFATCYCNPKLLWTMLICRRSAIFNFTRFANWFPCNTFKHLNRSWFRRFFPHRFQVLNMLFIESQLFRFFFDYVIILTIRIWLVFLIFWLGFHFGCHIVFL